ncbi:MAG: radical SAM protein [Bacteroidales bacterium]|nr:radical SAM protein [Bacteroidales bacterium]
MLHSYEDCQKSKRSEAENFHIIESESNKIDQHTLAQLYNLTHTPSQVSCHRSPVTENPSQVTGHRSQVTENPSQVTCHRSQVTENPSQVTGPRSQVTENPSQVTGHSPQFAVVVNPPEPPMTTDELDHSFDLPYMRVPHPKYKKRGAVPAFEMIKNSVNIHRGCFGGCSFCTISAHQGKQVVSRSERSILNEVRMVASSEGFNGVLTDLGGPSANMYGMHGRNQELCRRCTRYSCIHPTRCRNLQCDHQPLIDLYRKAASVKGVKHLYIGSGIRCDLFYDDNHGSDYFREVVLHHVSGRLKVAPEHTSERVLRHMRKPTFDLFERTKQDFDHICATAGLRYQLIPYFISSHPGCTLGDMAELAVTMKKMGYRLEQIQDFTPTPMTLSTEMYYTGINPDTMEPVFVETVPERKREQNLLFFYYKPENRDKITTLLRRTHNEKYLPHLYPQPNPNKKSNSHTNPYNTSNSNSHHPDQNNSHSTPKPNPNPSHNNQRKNNTKPNTRPQTHHNNQSKNNTKPNTRLQTHNNNQSKPHTNHQNNPNHAPNPNSHNTDQNRLHQSLKQTKSPNPKRK